MFESLVYNTVSSGVAAWRMSAENHRRLACIAAAYLVLNVRPRRQRRWWQRQLLQRRHEYSGDDFRSDLTAGCLFTNFTRMSNADFEHLITILGPDIAKEDTKFRKAISVQDRLAITLRFLATGDSYHSLMYLFKVSKQCISQIVPEVCSAIVNRLSKYVETPDSPEKWRKIAHDFKINWQFDQCLGALDGKHVILQCPDNSGSMFFNYKNQHSIVLLALVDSKYNFIYVNVGCQGRISDGGVFKNCSLWATLQTGESLPGDNALPGRVFAVPYVIVADDAFALHKHILKPFSGHQMKNSKERVFNYRLSRARRCSENAFGIMSSVFRVLRKPMLLSPQKATLVTCACVYLHNFLRASKTSVNIYTPHGATDIVLSDGSVVPGDWRREQEGMTSCYTLPRVARKPSEFAQAVRQEYASYFNSDIGSVPWQNNND